MRSRVTKNRRRNIRKCSKINWCVLKPVIARRYGSHRVEGSCTSTFSGTKFYSRLLLYWVTDTQVFWLEMFMLSKHASRRATSNTTPLNNGLPRRVSITSLYPECSFTAAMCLGIFGNFLNWVSAISQLLWIHSKNYAHVPDTLSSLWVGDLLGSNASAGLLYVIELPPRF